MSSRIAAFSRPFASVGNAGQITFRPPTWANSGSGFWEWNADARTPPPEGPRRTIGSGTPLRYVYFAVVATISSNPHVMKSAYWNSAIGRNPSMAAPTDMPTIVSSAIGVSITRSGPNRSMNPSVTLNAPP